MIDAQDHNDCVHCDVLVIGSGAGGLSAAATAACLGLKVIVLEKASQFGGTTAWSGGWMWIPRNPLAVQAGLDEPIDAPLTYLRHELGDQFGGSPTSALSLGAARRGPDHRQARLQAFLEHGPQMVQFYREHTSVQFIDGNQIPDFHGNSPGAVDGGRSVCAAPFDARELGARIHLLRPPLDLNSLWGMGIASGADLRHFMNATRHWASFVHAAKRITRHLFERWMYGRGMHLVAGNALAARLAKTLFDHDGELRVGTRVTELLHDASSGSAGSRQAPLRVVGARAIGAYGLSIEFRARRGVVLACGGFPHDTRRKRRLFAHAPTGKEHWSAAPASNTGDGLRMAEKIGARVRNDLPHPAAWAPVSLVTRKDGSVGAFAHLIERGKPGLIAVTRHGKRFVNEANSYHDFMNALFGAYGIADPLRADSGKQLIEQMKHPLPPPIEAWLICDHHFLRRYGLGHVKPSPMPIGPALRSGYLKQGLTLAELAQACGIDPEGLQATIDHYNPPAQHGKDPAFGRGSTRYNRVQGDPQHGPNPCVAPIVQPPFYAVRVVPGSLGTFAGLDTDAQARVLNEDGQVIAGLYAAGNDMSSVMGGHYPSGGITLGPAMTFGFIAAHDLAGRPLASPTSTAERSGATSETPA